MDTIFLDAPNLGELEKQYLLKCVDSTFVSTAGPFIPEFEEKFAEYVGTKRAVSTQSGTAAIHLSLSELRVGPGDEVIVPVITFIASVNPIVYVGATPVFVDIDPFSWNMIPEQVEKAITKNTKAIIPVHIYGNPCDMDAITEISQRHGIPIIEDATESLGASVHGRKTGTFGSMACFSFNGNKVITTGGGGMITTNDVRLADHMKFLVNQARDESKGYYHPEIGFNYRMTNLEASLGLAQFERLPDFLQKKSRYMEIYREILTGVKGIEFQEEYPDSISSWWLSSIKINHATKDIPQIQKELKEKGIPTRRIFVPITEFPPYAKYKREEYPNSYELYEKGLNLPSSTLNSEEQAEFAARSIVDVIKA